MSREKSSRIHAFLPSPFWQRADLLSSYDELATELEQLQQSRQLAFQRLNRAHWGSYFEHLRELSALCDVDFKFSFDEGVVALTSSEEKEGREEVVQKLIADLIPWRKGPFSIDSNVVDAEWRSDKKWTRVLDSISSFAGERIADVGSGNGYSMFRLLEHEPECVVGFDPGEHAFLQFELLQSLLKDERIQLERFKDDVLQFFPRFFDTIFCMGVLYHHKNPLQLLHNIKMSLRPGGRLLLESQTYPADGQFIFFNEDRYAKAHNVYFVPSSDSLVSMIKKAGFKEVELCSEVEITFEEQRTTEHAPYESLRDFLNPEDSRYTIEGHKAPTRSIVTAKVPS